MVARSIASVLIWMGYLIGLLLLGQSFDLGGGVIALAFVLALPVIAMTVTMWENKSAAEKQAESETSGDLLEKRKRDRLDAILRELSDEQLAALKQRLSEPDFEDEVLYMLGDDGELVAPRQ
ncbi:MAG: hypothetical protein CL607_22500 [Anaerolineaceae bacterium]|nr:hypothetical protein [Anaerolineaceae bacterium]